MAEIEPRELTNKHSPEDVWRAINTPIPGKLGELVNPFVVIYYPNLNAGDIFQQGTLTTYTPLKDKLRIQLGMYARALPNDVDLHVAELDPQNRTRRDVLESEKHSGSLNYQVEEADDGTGLLIVGGEVSVGAPYEMFNDEVAMFAGKGLEAHYQRVLDCLPIILGQ